MARPKPLADLIDTCLGRSLASQGFAASDVIVAWPDIVGDRLARSCQPIRLDWPRRARGLDERPQPATLVVRVESAFALEMQHLAPLVIERVNAYYGWRCVGRLVLKQGPMPRAQERRERDPAPSEHDRACIAAATAPVADAPLRAALDRLGSAVLASRTKA
jgi:hypothetical protein